MIEEIAITDLGVIASARIELGPGLTVITGETGAGKTMVLTGLALLLGRKAEPAVVRPGAGTALAEGRFAPPPAHRAVRIAEDAGALLDDGVLLVSRSVAAQGRSRAHLGGRSVPAGLLAELGESLVTVHGQSDQLRLRETARQREALDTFAGHEQLVRAHAGAFGRCRELEAELRRWDAQEQDRAAELTRLQHAVERITDLALRPGEEAELRHEAERLGNVEDLRASAQAVRDALNAEDAEVPGALDLLEQARRALSAVEAFDPVVAEWGRRVAESSYLLSDLATEVAGYETALEADPQRLEQVHQRRAQIRELAAEYLGHDGDERDTADRLLDFAETAGARVADLTAPGGGRTALLERLEQARTQRLDLAATLSAGRQAAAARLCEAVGAEFAALAMPGAALRIELTERAEAAEHGAEDVTFLFTAHPGAPALPLGKGASGGELSRVMLAVEVALAASENEQPQTFVFDEVDAGVGGRAATEVGRRLALLARRAQVIVITHLAQVAAFADQHLVVTKHADGSVSASDIHRVQGPEREAELARMLSGDPRSQTALRHAADLLQRPSVRP